MTIPLSPQQVYNIQKRLPPFELSYETIAHKKVFDSYPLCLAIPTGKKSFAWLSFHNDQDVCYFMELNREKKISHISMAQGMSFDPSLSLGTLLYGTVILNDRAKPLGITESEIRINSEEEDSVFVVEDLYYYKGVSMKQHTMGEKFGYLEQFFHLLRGGGGFQFFLPFLWGISKTREENELIQDFETHSAQIPYPVHHLQLRKLTELSPYLNIQLYNRRFDKGITNDSARGSIVLPNYSGEQWSPLQGGNCSIKLYISRMSSEEFTTSDSNDSARGSKSKASDPFKKPETKRPLPSLFEKELHKPQYRYPTVFWVSADIQYDIYHLFAYDNKGMIYYDIAYIQNIKVSKMMNSLFRNIRENENLDYIEESDDEEDFENIAADKYVDLHKIIPMEFIFHRKFRKWVPIRLVEKDAKIIHIHRL